MTGECHGLTGKNGHRWIRSADDGSGDGHINHNGSPPQCLSRQRSTGWTRTNDYRAALNRSGWTHGRLHIETLGGAGVVYTDLDPFLGQTGSDDTPDGAP